jgi:hypothetical protein
MIDRRLLVVLLLAVSTLSGCGGKTEPVFVEVEGTLLLDDKPLPLALVEFMPDVKGHGAEVNSTAVTDTNGKFKLECGAKPGAMIASHRVVINEGPPPAGARGQDAASQAKLTEYMNALKNRPIPEVYGNFKDTSLRVEVKAEDKNIVLKMKR